MIEQKYLTKLREIMKAGRKGKDLTKALLCSVALGEKISENSKENRKTTQAFSGIRRYKFIRRTNNGGYSITQKGENILHKIIIDEIIIENKNNWNGKWYLVMYDFPIRFKKARNAFRWKLKDLGFIQFQKSAWVYPYPCEKEILFVAEFFGVQKYIEILEINRISNDKKLRSHFNL